MGKVLTITNGTTSIKLEDTTTLDGVWHISPGGVSNVQLSAEHIIGDDPSAGRSVIESYKLATFGDTIDDLFDTTTALWQLLREAALHHDRPHMFDPVWLVEQGRTETNPRYAKVYGPAGADIVNALMRSVDRVNLIQEFGISIEREHPWSSEPPETLPTALTLTDIQSGAVDIDVVAACLQDTSLDMLLKNYDSSAATYSADQIGSDPITLFPGTPAVNDAIVFAYHNRAGVPFVFPIETAGAYTATMSLQYYTTSWQAMVLGTDYLVFCDGALVTDIDDVFKTAGLWVIFPIVPADIATLALGGDTEYWYKLEMTAFTSMGTNPVSGSATKVTRAASANYVELPAAALVGDHLAQLLVRFFQADGYSETDPGMGALSGILMGAKSINLGSGEFVSDLQFHSDGLATGWARTLGTDTSQSDDADAPAGKIVHVDFSTDSSMVVRVTLVGADKLQYYPGKYEIFVVCKQYPNPTEDNEINFKLRFSVGDLGDTAPKSETKEVFPSCSAIGNHWEVLSLGEVDLPFGAVAKEDSLAADLNIELLAERTTGSGEIYLSHIFLLPVDEWAIGLVDPLSNTDFGSSALREFSLIDVDGGVVQRRVLKQLRVGSNVVPGENWNYDGSLPRVEAGRKTRIYTMPLHYVTGWGDDSNLAMHAGEGLVVQVFARPGFVWLRGDN